MKRISKSLAFAFALIAGGTAIAQQAPNNAGFENWQNLGSSDEEPTNWNGMMTGNLCGFCGLGASQRVFRDGSEFHGGSYSARIESTTYLGNIVNGTISTGEINAPSTTPSEGYTKTVRTNGNFNHPFTDKPDSVVIWAKYNITDASDQARIAVTLHGDYDVRDPADAGSNPFITGRAVQNFQTGGTANWVRVSTPFDYASYPGTSINYVLATITASYSAGNGNGGATLWVDDMEYIYNPPVANFSASTITICEGESIDFTDLTTSTSNVTAWAWDFGDGGTATTQDPTYTFNTAGNWTVQLTSTNSGGTDSFTMGVTVNPSPTITTSGNVSICDGDNTTISASGASSLTWDQGLGAGASHTVSPTTTTTYTVTGSDAGCSTDETVTVTVNAVPSVTGMGSTTICEGESTPISASGATSYSWDQGLGGGSSHTVSPTTSTNYTVTGTTSGCSNTAIVSITVLPAPNVVGNGTTAICEGGTANIFGSGASSYSWDQGLGAGTSHNVSPTTTTTYTVTGTTGACSATDQVTITVDTQSDPGTAVSLTACVSDNNVDLNQGVSGEDLGGTWLDDDLTGGVSGSNYDAAIAGAGTYSFTYTFPANGACPSVSTTTQITVTNSVDAGTPTALDDACEDNNSVDLYGTIAGYTIGGSWNDDNSTGALSGSTFDPSAVIPGSYNFTYTINGGTCGTDSETITFTVNALPAVTASSDVAICEGDNTPISATGAQTYDWDNSLGLGASHTVSPTATTTYTVTGTDANNCSNTDQVTVTVNSLPTVSAGTDLNLCDGDDAILNGSGANSYAWDNSVIDGVSFTPSIGTVTYTVTGTDANGCSNTDQVDVTVNALPTVSVAAFGQDTICTTDAAIALPTGTPAGGSYSGWGVSGSNFDPSLVVPGTHDVYYTYADANSCEGMASTTIEVVLCLGLFDNELVAYNIYPNPASDELKIEFEQAVDADVLITDDRGRLVYSSEVNEANISIDIAKWTPGTYFVQLQDENGQTVDSHKVSIVR